MTYGRLTITGDAGRARNGSVLWSWRCRCGTEGRSRATAIRTGITQSCGCLRREQSHRLVPGQRTRFVSLVTHRQYLDACEIAEARGITSGRALHLLSGVDSRNCVRICQQAETQGLAIFQSWKDLDLP